MALSLAFGGVVILGRMTSHLLLHILLPCAELISVLGVPQNKFYPYKILPIGLYKMHHRKKFFSFDTIVSFLLGKHSAALCDDLYFSFDNLRQYSSNALVTCISIEYKICILVTIIEGR